MRHLFSNWKKIEGLIRRSGRVLLLADYDGTLTPIASRPEGALLDSDLRKALKSLSKKRKFYIGVISGRKLSDVKRLVGLRGVYYAGNHGLRISGPGISFKYPSLGKFKPYLNRIRDELRARTGPIKGVIVEDKGGTISLHYRLVKRKDVKRLKAIFKEVCAPYVKRGGIKTSSGKKVWEVRLPVRWDKGSAAGKILKTLTRRTRGVLPVYLGDDTTDEDVFYFLKKRRKAITVFIGPKKKRSGARYYLKSPAEVRKFLVRLCRI